MCFNLLYWPLSNSVQTSRQLARKRFWRLYWTKAQTYVVVVMNSWSEFGFRYVLVINPDTIFSAWRVTRGPNRNWPLALCDYQSLCLPDDLEFVDVIHREYVGELIMLYGNSTHKWFFLDHEDVEDVLLFKHADSQGINIPCKFILTCGSRLLLTTKQSVHMLPSRIHHFMHREKVLKLGWFVSTKKLRWQRCNLQTAISWLLIHYNQRLPPSVTGIVYSL